MQPDDEKKEGQQANTPASTGPIQQTVASAPSATATASPERKGSGRFTNIQKYLQANRQGGQQVAQGIGQNIQGGLSQQKEQSQQGMSELRQGIEAGKATAQQGGQFLQDLKGIGQNIQQATGAQNAMNRPQDLGIQQFAQQPGFQQFQDIQAGRGIDENLLRSQQSDLARSSGQYLAGAQQAAQQLGSEGGRFGLLKQTFGGQANPQYSTGQQRLDQLFLARQGLQPLQQEVRQDIKTARELGRQASQAGSDVGRLVGQEKQLVSDIGQQAMSNEQAYMDMLSSYVPEINRLRGEEYDSAKQAFENRYGMSQEQLSRLGVQSTSNIYDVLDDLSFEDVAVRGRDAITAKDVATGADVSRLAALSQIAGSQGPQITEAANLGQAYTSEEGERSLASRLEKRGKDLEQQNINLMQNLKNSYGPVEGNGVSWGWANTIKNINSPQEFMELAKTDPVAKGYVNDVQGFINRGTVPTNPVLRSVYDIIKQNELMSSIGNKTFSDPSGKRVAVGSQGPGATVNTMPFGRIKKER